MPGVAPCGVQGGGLTFTSFPNWTARLGGHDSQLAETVFFFRRLELQLQRTRVFAIGFST
jgi:hypothetical protein